jgi:hypothetical protein
MLVEEQWYSDQASCGMEFLNDQSHSEESVCSTPSLQSNDDCCSTEWVSIGQVSSASSYGKKARVIAPELPAEALLPDFEVLNPTITRDFLLKGIYPHAVISSRKVFLAEKQSYLI